MSLNNNVISGSRDQFPVISNAIVPYTVGKPDQKSVAIISTLENSSKLAVTPQNRDPNLKIAVSSRKKTKVLEVANKLGTILSEGSVIEWTKLPGSIQTKIQNDITRIESFFGDLQDLDANVEEIPATYVELASNFARTGCTKVVNVFKNVVGGYAEKTGESIATTYGPKLTSNAIDGTLNWAFKAKTPESLKDQLTSLLWGSAKTVVGASAKIAVLPILTPVFANVGIKAGGLAYDASSKLESYLINKYILTEEKKIFSPGQSYELEVVIPPNTNEIIINGKKLTEQDIKDLNQVVHMHNIYSEMISENPLKALSKYLIFNKENKTLFYADGTKVSKKEVESYKSVIDGAINGQNLFNKHTVAFGKMVEKLATHAPLISDEMDMYFVQIGTEAKPKYLSRENGEIVEKNEYDKLKASFGMRKEIEAGNAAEFFERDMSAWVVVPNESVEDL